MKIENADGGFTFVTVKSKEGKAELAKRAAAKAVRVEAKKAKK